tara:strand:- start:239 stop:508 length:270 start_codon:yes stop_codon:yes gene_type:complete
MIVCKGVCTYKGFATKRPNNSMPFLTHMRCRMCAIWVDKAHAWNGNRCPCCHGMMGTRPHANTRKKKYIPYNTTRAINKLRYASFAGEP